MASVRIGNTLPVDAAVIAVLLLVAALAAVGASYVELSGERRNDAMVVSGPAVVAAVLDVSAD